ncbi:MAG: histidine kinase, partial [bacterium]|nr:histidine kinase [bacterium]
KGVLTIATKAVGSEAVCILIADTGPGVPPGIIDRIFDPFFTTKGESGSGLGLSVVYGVIRRHNGWINVDTTPNGGTTFKCWIPAYFPVDSEEGDVERH